MTATMKHMTTGEFKVAAKTWGDRLADLCREGDAEIGTRAVVMLLMAFAGQGAKHTGLGVEPVLHDFRQMLIEEFDVTLVKVVAQRGDNPYAEEIEP